MQVLLYYTIYKAYWYTVCYYSMSVNCLNDAIIIITGLNGVIRSIHGRNDVIRIFVRRVKVVCDGFECDICRFVIMSADTK